MIEIIILALTIVCVIIGIYEHFIIKRLRMELYLKQCRVSVDEMLKYVTEEDGKINMRGGDSLMTLISDIDDDLLDNHPIYQCKDGRGRLQKSYLVCVDNESPYHLYVLDGYDLSRPSVFMVIDGEKQYEALYKALSYFSENKTDQFDRLRNNPTMFKRYGVEKLALQDHVTEAWIDCLKEFSAFVESRKTK